MTLILWHNPRCSKSRQTLSLLRDHGHEPHIRRYLDDPPSVAELHAVHAHLGGPVMDMVRRKESAFAEAGLSGTSSDDEVYAALAANPILIERPILLTEDAAAIGRPPEKVLEILP